jgi:hypothetical protein
MLVIGILAVTPANAVEVRWNAGNGNFLWSGANWQDTAGNPAPAPLAGDKVVFDDNYTPGGNCGIDMAGAIIDLGTGSLGHGYGGRNWSFYDSATLAPNNNPLANPTDFNLGVHASLEAASSASALLLKVRNSDWSKSGTPRFFLPVEITGTFKTPEAGTLEFYGPAKINYHAEPRNRGWNSKLYFRNSADITTMDVVFRNGVDGEDVWFYGATNIGTLNQDGGEVFFEPTSTATIGTLNLSRGIFNTQIVPSITTVNWTGGVWVAGADGALPSAAPFALSSGQALRFDAVQISLPVITVGAGGALAGNMTNVVYTPGPGQNVIFQNDGIHAPSPEAATPLQKSDLGAGVGVWLGVTSRGAGDVWQAGDDGTNPYKGLAFDTNSFTPGGETRSTFKALPGSGDLLLRVSSLLDLEYRGPYWIGDGTSTTANFDMVGQTSSIDLRRRFNQGSTDADRILTFNITRAPGNEQRNILTTNQQTGVYADQTINVTGGAIGNLDAMKSRFEGSLTLTDGTWAMGNDFTAADTGTLTLAGRTVMQLPTADNVNNDFIEALGSRFSYSGLPMVTFSDKNGGPFIYEFDLDQSASGTAPELAKFLANVDYGSNHYHPVDIGGDGLLIGDGKFLADAGTTNATSSYVARNTTGSLPKILPGQPGAITMGFAAVAKNLSIGLEVDAPDATVQVGTTDPNRLITYGGTGFTAAAIPTMRVTFQQNVNAKGVKIESGTGQFDQDLNVDTLSIRAGAALRMAGGKTATVSQMLSGTGMWTGGNGVVLAPGATVGPGYSVGGLNKGGGGLQFSDALTYEWELGDPDLAPGTGWDLLWGDSLRYVGQPGQGVLTILFGDAGLTRPVAANETFAIAAGSFDIPDDLAVLFDAGTTGWNVSNCQLVPGTDVIDGQREDVIFLTGLSSILNQPPVADADGPYQIVAGDALLLDGSGSSDPDGDPLTYLWDLDNDEVFGDVTGVSPLLQWADALAWGLLPGDGVTTGLYTIGLEVNDGTVSSFDTARLTVLIPEPATCVLLTIGLAGLVARRRRR